MNGVLGMDQRQNRKIKAYCPDFAPIRRLLGELDAAFVEIKEQVDFYYNLPESGDGEGTRRLKLRVEHGQRQIIYYYDRQENGARSSQFQLWYLGDPQIKDVLDAALGVRAVVHNNRKLWRKDNAIFNLDSVEDIGHVFEVEVQHDGVRDIEAQVQEYRRIFGPYLGGIIEGSNEDLVRPSPSTHPH